MRRVFVGIGVSICTAGLVLAACTGTSSRVEAAPLAGAGQDSAAGLKMYTEKVVPIFQANCYRCHGGMNHRGGFVMDTKAGMAKGGHDGAVIVVDGGLGHAGWSWGPKVWGMSGGWDGVNCRGSGDHVRVAVQGKEVALADLPLVTIRTPMDVHVGGSGAVFGEVGPSASLDLANAGCGDWRAADTRGDLSIALSGSGDVHAGAAGASQVRISGSGDVFMGTVKGALETRTSGSGDIRAASVRGPINTAIAGSGNVVVDGGEASQVGVKIAGSGDFKFRGVAGAVSASIAGSGDVDIARATGPVSRHVAGSGDVNIGR